MKLVKELAAGAALAAILTVEAMLALVGLVFTLYIVAALTDPTPGQALVWLMGTVFIMILGVVLSCAFVRHRSGPDRRP